MNFSMKSAPQRYLPLVAAAAFVIDPPTAALAQNLDSISSMEIARRQETLVYADKLVEQGDRALAQKNYEAAYVSYLDALDKIPAGAATNSKRAAVLKKFSDAGILYAKDLINNGRYADAERVAKTILLPQYNPTYKPAVAILANLEQPDYYNKTVTPKFAADRDEVTKLLHEAEGYFQTGRFDLAMKRYEQVLNIDPYNIAARKGMEQVNLDKSRYYNNAYNETRSRMLWLVDRSWERPVHQFQGGRTSVSEAQGRGGIRGTEAIAAKLNRIIIPKIDLRDTTVREAVEYLKQQSKNLDTTTTNPQEKRGVNIVLKLDSANPAATPDPSAPAPAEGTPTAPVSGSADTPITLALNNVPLIEALRYLTELANLKYKIEPYAVSIVPLTENTTDLVTKEYRVPPGFIPTTAASSSADSPAAGASSINATDSHISSRVNALEYLQSQGITFPQGAFAQYVAAGSKLVVRNTPDAIDLIDTLVDAAVGVQPTQVEIESKFIEITQNNLKELGFDWTVGPFSIGQGVYGAGGTPASAVARTTDTATGLTGGTTVSSLSSTDYPFLNAAGGVVGADPVTGGNRSGIGNSALNAISSNSIDALISGLPAGPAPAIFGLAGIFTNPQFQLVIRALNQKKGIDLMSAPKVTTKSGHKATVRMVREFPYPTEFNPPEPPPPDTSTTSRTLAAGTIVTQGIVTPTTPTSFETRNLGVTLEVEPIIGPDGYTIDLNLSPEVVEFDGFVNYGSPILGAQFNGITIVNNILSANVINQPIFSTRKVTTSVSIWDGQTVALGGLIREDVQKVQDKVPLLGDIPIAGRLFRSDVDQKIKRNLIIFVTARLMDAEGKPVRQDEDQEEIVEPLGLPQELPPPTYTQSLGK